MNKIIYPKDNTKKELLRTIEWLKKRLEVLEAVEKAKNPQFKAPEKPVVKGD